jgi:hypothetical protein
MAIRIQNSTIIDDNRNIVDAGIGTFNNALNVGSAGTIFSATTRISSENVLSVRNSSNASALEVTGIGSVGIGTTNPQRSLHIEGNGIIVSSASNTIFSAETTSAGSNILSVRNSSNLPALEITGVGSMGVGIATPTRTLHVAGNGFVVSSGVTTLFSAETYSGSGNILSITGINNYPAMEVSGIGSVGIGTTVPRKSLHVEGNGVLFTNNNNTLLSVESFSGQSDKVLDIRDSSNNTILGVTTNVFSYSNPIQSVFSVESVSNSSSIFSVVNNANTSALEVTGIGSVGIGITTPTRALHVNGNGVVVSAGATSIFSIDTSNNSGSSFEVLSNSGGIAMQVTGIGSVGFGVSNPTRSLHVEGNGLLVSVGSTAVFSVDSAVGTSNIFEVLDPNNNVLLGISTVNVGVGTTNPTSKLHVVGDAQISRVGLGTTAGALMDLLVNGATAIKQDIIAPSSGVYTIDITSANEFVTSSSVTGITTFNLSNLGQLPTGFIWRGVLSFGYVSGTVNWFTGNVGYGVTWDGNYPPTLTANEVETIIISVGGGSTTIQASYLNGRGI